MYFITLASPPPPNFKGSHILTPSVPVHCVYSGNHRGSWSKQPISGGERMSRVKTVKIRHQWHHLTSKVLHCSWLSLLLLAYFREGFSCQLLYSPNLHSLVEGWGHMGSGVPRAGGSSVQFWICGVANSGIKLPCDSCICCRCLFWVPVLSVSCSLSWDLVTCYQVKCSQTLNMIREGNGEYPPLLMTQGREGWSGKTTIPKRHLEQKS